jgi:hypothetical protein
MAMQFKETPLTIFTIPETFVHIETGKHHKVTPEMHVFFQKHIQQHSLIDAFMTAIFHHVHGERQAIDLERLETKMEEVLHLLKEKNFCAPAPEQTDAAQVDFPEQLDELLDEFGG